MYASVKENVRETQQNVDRNGFSGFTESKLDACIRPNTVFPTHQHSTFIDLHFSSVHVVIATK